MLLPVAWWDLVMLALSALSDTLCPDVGLKLWNRPLSGFWWWASSCETDHYWVLMTGLKLWNRPLPGFWWRASGCETDHYLASDDGPQAVKQTITWLLMTGLQLWNRPLLLPWVPMTGLALVRPVYLTAWAIRMQNESGDLYFYIGQIKSEYKQRWHKRNSV